MNVNKIILIGHVTKDPEVRYASDGKAICNLGLATNYKTKEKDEVEFHELVLFERLAEIAKEYVKKGAPLYIEGRIRTREYESHGTKVKVKEVIVQNMQLLGKKEV